MSIPLIVDGNQIKEAPEGASIDLTSNEVLVATPTENGHPATKQYVDDAVAAGGGGDFATEAYVDDSIINTVGDVQELFTKTKLVVPAVNFVASSVEDLTAVVDTKAVIADDGISAVTTYSSSKIEDLVAAGGSSFSGSYNDLTDKPDLSGYATESFVSDSIAAIPATDLTGYATETFVSDAIAAIPDTDLSGYATTQYVDDAVAASGGGGGDFLPLTGGNLTGPINIDTGIEGVATMELNPFNGAISINDPTTQGFSQLGGGNIILGSATTNIFLENGQISASTNSVGSLPTSPLHLTTKRYVDQQVATKANSADVFTKAETTSAIATATSSAGAMDYAYMVRDADQLIRRWTEVVFNRQVNSNEVDNPNGFSISSSNNDLIFWPTGYVEFKANRTYLLRATLYLNIPNGFNGRIGWARRFADGFGGFTYSPVHQGPYGAMFWGTGGQNIQCVSSETVFRPTTNENLYFVIWNTTDTNTQMTLKAGSTAFVQRIA